MLLQPTPSVFATSEDERMPDPIIAIVGSANAARTDYAPPLRNVGKVSQAAQELGRELAKANYGIMVYSPNPAYIEAAVVEGYVTSNVARPGSIQVRYPRGAEAGSRFPEQDTHPTLFDPRPTTYSSWEVCFYQSLKEADGVLILGGGSSALITGVTARLLRLSVVAVATFGGSADNVWVLMRDQGLANVTDEDHRIMGRASWESDSAAQLVRLMTEQRARRLKEEETMRMEQLAERGRAKRRAAITMGLFISAILAAGTALVAPLGPGGFLTLFFAAPLLAGAAGGIARNVLDLFQGTLIPRGRDELSGVVLGAMAGFVSAVLFVLAQWMTMTETVNKLVSGPDPVPVPLRVLVLFELVIALTAGLTIELVFSKLRGRDALDPAAWKPA
jgi:hypothetical protein